MKYGSKIEEKKPENPGDYWGKVGKRSAIEMEIYVLLIIVSFIDRILERKGLEQLDYNFKHSWFIQLLNNYQQCS